MLAEEDTHVLGAIQVTEQILIFLFVAMALMHGLLPEVTDGLATVKPAVAYIKEVHFLVQRQDQKAVAASVDQQEEEEELVVTEVHQTAPAQVAVYLVEAVVKVEPGMFRLPVQAIKMQPLVLMVAVAVAVVIPSTLINLDMDMYFFMDLAAAVAELECMV
jgi:hypothetical protein